MGEDRKLKDCNLAAWGVIILSVKCATRPCCVETRAAHTEPAEICYAWSLWQCLKQYTSEWHVASIFEDGVLRYRRGKVSEMSHILAGIRRQWYLVVRKPSPSIRCEIYFLWIYGGCSISKIPWVVKIQWEAVTTLNVACWSHCTEVSLFCNNPVSTSMYLSHLGTSLKTLWH